MLQLMEDVACQWSVWIDLAKAKRRLEEEVQCDDLRGTTLRDEDSEKMRDGFTWDDVLFLGEQQWLSDVFLPGLKEEFKLSSTLVDRSTGGTFEFLKRFHVVEPHYTEITVYPEEKQCLRELGSEWKASETLQDALQHFLYNHFLDAAMEKRLKL